MSLDKERSRIEEIIVTACGVAFSRPNAMQLTSNNNNLKKRRKQEESKRSDSSRSWNARGKARQEGTVAHKSQGSQMNHRFSPVHLGT